MRLAPPVQPGPRLRSGILILSFAWLAGCSDPPPPEPPSTSWAKLDGAGQVLEADQPHACVHDTRSGLYWEVKRGTGLHDPDDTFSWYHDDPQVHMTEPGVRDGGDCGEAPCDTRAFVKRVNQAGLCGFNDWTLPTREQLSSLADPARIEKGQVLDPAFFPRAIVGEYWTRETFRLYPLSAWAVSSLHGLDRADLKEKPKAVRLVRQEGVPDTGAKE